jgi:hypothetical protein
MPTIELTDNQVLMLRCATNGLDLDKLKDDLWLFYETKFGPGELFFEFNDLRGKLRRALK